MQERDLGDEYGWKQVHGDVFRSPPSSLFFTSLIGTGYQLAAVLMIVIIFIIMGDLYVGQVINSIFRLAISYISTYNTYSLCTLTFVLLNLSYPFY